MTAPPARYTVTFPDGSTAEYDDLDAARTAVHRSSGGTIRITTPGETR